VGEEHHAYCALDYAQVPFELDRTGRDPHCPLLAPVFRFSSHDLASVATLGVTVVGLSHLSTPRTLDQLGDVLLLRNLLEVLVAVADGQDLEGCLAAFSGMRVLG
jgi:hypothetical protein